MPRPGKSQWDFGELFAPEQTRRVWSVSELTGQVQRVLEQQFGTVWVAGEVSNLRAQPSGHVYFTVKDAGAQLPCVLFRGTATAGRALLDDGRQVLLQGDLTVYAPRGQYQLVVRAVEVRGAGALQVAFEQLKQKLGAEGLFAPERKRPLPAFPSRIGVVTSPTGAALRDVLHVVQRRHPGLALVLAPCRVQGAEAAAEIAAAIALLNEFSRRLVEGEPPGRPGLDAILLTRGGGSLEDLWAFNEEIVARAIHASALPVVSAVGHEVDFTISDFVADVRAATPSAAAEILTQDFFGCRPFVKEAPARLALLARQRLAAKREDAGAASRQLARRHPRRRLEAWSQRLDDAQTALLRAGRMRARVLRGAWQAVAGRLLRLRPSPALARRREALGNLRAALARAVATRLRVQDRRLDALTGRLRLLSPQSVLDRGYSITFDAATGVALRDAAQARAGQPLRTRLGKGEVRSRVE